MQININTNNHVEGSQRMKDYFKGVVADSLKRFEDKVTRVEVHVGDENSHKEGDTDKKCTIEARIAGMQPVAVTNHSNTVEKAVDGAIDKIKKVLDTTFDKMRAH
ncbi:HPF/RaiA family ribosome-associated protein [Flavobacterium rakeshii]|uniref:HPF/RaiA family ribosome-associated protein n=1 Tax=Flavobacterium rakeshii TaxID=1038845 RepID=A0A6N8HGK8_9FLAO|nr:HPF/RaiA family ribosome-associated protein [Flavobacterium rakeshii]MEE1897596.1 HPF/RaiA family ribosome-associated protein [Flavobacterium rakeshii]MUV04813.1 HPF/RaiA family ribosome-associated protein [Flavobacterium rakeshii]